MGNLCKRNAARGSRPYSEKKLLAKKEKLITVMHKMLYNIENKDFFLSFERYSGIKMPEIFPRDLYIKKNSFKLIKDIYSNNYSLSFSTYQKIECELSMYFFSYELINTEKNTLNFCSSNQKSPSPLSYSLIPNSKEIKTDPILNLVDFSQDELNFEDRRTFPIIIVMKSSKQCLLNYLKIEGEFVIKVREVYWRNDELHEIADLYFTEEQDCAICMIERSCIAIMPCRHVSLCEGCLNYIMARERKCPICRSLFTIGYKIQV